MSNIISGGVLASPLESAREHEQDVGAAGASSFRTPVFSGDDAVTQASILLVQAFRNERSEARKAAEFAEQFRVREGEARVHELHEKADEVRKAGLVKGIATAAGGAFTIAGGAFALSNESDCTAQKFMTLGSGSGKVFEGAGGMIGSRYDANATDHDANAAAHEARGEAARTVRDEATAQANDAKQSAANLTEALKEITAARNATVQAAIIRA